MEPPLIGEERLLSISQFAACTGISRSALIYYDEIGLLSPAERGRDNGYRYYRAQQIITANLINVLAELDIPLRMIKDLMRDRSSEHILELFNTCYQTLEEHVARLHKSERLIDVFRSLLTMAKDADESVVSINTLPQWNLIMGPPTNFEENQSFYVPFLRFCNWARKQGHSTNFPIGGHFTDFESFSKHPGEPDNFFLLLSTNDKSTETHKALCAYSRGFYGETGDVAERMAEVIREKKIKAVGPVLCLFLEDEISTMDPSKYLMQAIATIQ